MYCKETYTERDRRRCGQKCFWGTFVENKLVFMLYKSGFDSLEIYTFNMQLKQPNNSSENLSIY